VFEAAVSMRFLQKRSKFGKVRRTGSNVHQRFLLPMCLCSSDRCNGRLRPLLLPFPVERKRMGLRGLSACLTFCFYESNLQLTALKVFFKKLSLNHLCAF